MFDVSNLVIRRPKPADVANLATFIKCMQMEYESIEKIMRPNEAVNFMQFKIPGGLDLGSYYNKLNKLHEWVAQVSNPDSARVYLLIDSKQDAIIGVFSICKDFDSSDYQQEGALSICIAPAYRRAGVGTYLIHYCRGFFCKMGVPSFDVVCEDNDDMVIGFFESNPFIKYSDTFKYGPYDFRRYAVDCSCNIRF